MLSATLMLGNRAYDWNTMPTFRSWGGVRLMSWPSMEMVPDVGSSKPAIMRRVVVLPQPLGPRKDTNSPRATSQVEPLDRHMGGELLAHRDQLQERHRRLPT